MPQITLWAARVLLAGFFAAGAVQKAVSPQGAEALLVALGLSGMLVWPALVFNALGALCLISGLWISPMAALLALYCMLTSVFHYVPDDPWQMSILVKNWAIAGGLLALSAACQWQHQRHA